MKKQGLKAVQALPNGYDPDFVAKNAQCSKARTSCPQFLAFEQHAADPRDQERSFKWVGKIERAGRRAHRDRLDRGDEFYTGLKLRRARVLAGRR